MAREGDGSSLVTNFCISFALLFRMDARSFEKEPLRRVRPTHFIQVEHFVFFYPGQRKLLKEQRKRDKSRFCLGGKHQSSHTKTTTNRQAENEKKGKKIKENTHTENIG
jgi:hypothetical protein